MDWKVWALNNSGWLIPTGLVAANVIVKLTPWRGDDSLLKIVIDSYRTVTGRGTARASPENKNGDATKK